MGKTKKQYQSQPSLDDAIKEPSWTHEFADWLDLLAQGVPYEEADMDNIKTRNRSNSIKIVEWDGE